MKKLEENSSRACYNQNGNSSVSLKIILVVRLYKGKSNAFHDSHEGKYFRDNFDKRN